MLIFIGIILGAGICLAGMFVFMPKLMIVTKESKFDFQTTVNKLEESIAKNAWSHKGTTNISEELEKVGEKSINKKIAIVKLCKGTYAKTILEQHAARFVSCLMPCGISVWEGDDNKVYLSKMNTGLMGKMFGGIIAEIMGGKVEKEETAILEEIIK